MSTRARADSVRSFERLAILALPDDDERRFGDVDEHLGEGGQRDREPLLRVEPVDPEDPPAGRRSVRAPPRRTHRRRPRSGRSRAPRRERPPEERRRRFGDGDADGHPPPHPAKDRRGQLHRDRPIEIGVDRRHDGRRAASVANIDALGVSGSWTWTTSGRNAASAARARRYESGAIGATVPR